MKNRNLLDTPHGRIAAVVLLFVVAPMMAGLGVAAASGPDGPSNRSPQGLYGYVIGVLDTLGITSGGSYTAPTLATVLASGADGGGTAQTNLGNLTLASSKGITFGASGSITNSTGDLTISNTAGASALNLSASNIAASSSGVAVVGSVLATGFALDKRSWAQIRHEESSGTAGGTFTLGDWRTRTLNTLVDPEGIVTSLTSNQFTLAAGTYEIHAVVQANKVNGNQIRVYDTTNTTTLVLGLTCYAYTLDGPVPTLLQGRFTLSGSAAIELQHYGAATRATDGFGAANSFGVNEVYADVIIYRIN